MTSSQLYIKQTLQWIQSFVIDLNLCPFAKREIDKGSVKIQVSQAINVKNALQDFELELSFLDSKATTETTFLLFPFFLKDFFEYLDFTDSAVLHLRQKGYEGIYQLASFHPDYCFAEVNTEDVSNYTNRSPYPMLHILREDSVEKAIAYYGNTEKIPTDNCKRLNELGLEKVKKLANSLFD